MKAYLRPAVLIMALLPCMGMTFADVEDVKAANDAALQWLALVDAGKYGESWDQASSFFKEKVTKEQWQQAIGSARAPLGKAESRQFKVVEFKSELPQAPKGSYAVIQYRTKFANSPPMIETITPMLESGTWKVSGYYIKPEE